MHQIDVHQGDRREKGMGGTWIKVSRDLVMKRETYQAA
jgi:hypothetical protein